MSPKNNSLYILNKIFNCNFYCLLLLSFNSLFGQNITDLEQSLKTSDDADKANIYNQLAELNLSNKPEKSIEYAQLSVKFAKQNKDILEEALANINLGDANKVLKNNSNAITFFNLASQLLINSKNNANLSVVYAKLSSLYILENNLEKAFSINQLANELFIRTNDKKGSANCLINIGDIYGKQTKYEDAIKNYNEALKYYQSTNDNKMLVRLYSRIGNTYSNFGDFNNAKINLNKAFDIASKSNLNSDAETILKSIEVVNKNSTNFNKSQTNFAAQEKHTLVDNADYLIRQNNLSITEIEKLSIENQVKAFKLKAQQDELIKTKIEADNKAKKILLLEKETELKEINLQKQKVIIFIISLGLAIVTLLVLFIVHSLRITKKQKNIIQVQKNIVDEKQRRIISGINAASIIQSSILPRKNLLDKLLLNHFIIYLPKDIVSGDFYWVKDLGSEILFAVIDCTGHGVPGAFMSLHGYNLLERIVMEKKIRQPNQILDELNTSIIQTMADDKDVAYVKNGMDMTLIKLNKVTNELEFCGAKNNLLISRNNTIIEMKSDRMSIGHIFEGSFNLKKEKLQSADIIYLYTDGFKDQKGGRDNRCFLDERFKKLLIEVSSLDLDEQVKVIQKNHFDWKGTNEQTDDICLVGIKIN